MKTKIFCFLVLMVVASSCKKWVDTPGDKTDPRLQRPYCNDPAAVNYDWDFPGTPDNKTCLYPTDVFKGNYIYTDSIYDANQNFVRQQVLNISIVASSLTKMNISGFCNSGSLSFTASRQIRADADTIGLATGQALCRPVDTLSGFITRDGVGGLVLFNLTVNSDTGVAYHRGSAEHL